MNMMIYIRSSQ